MLCHAMLATPWNWQRRWCLGGLHWSHGNEPSGKVRAIKHCRGDVIVLRRVAAGFDGGQVVLLLLEAGLRTRCLTVQISGCAGREILGL